LIEDIVISALILGGLYALLSLGFSLIVGVARIMNFAHGALYMLAAYMIWSGLSFGLGLSIVSSLFFTVLIGLVIYKLLIGPLREKGIEAALVTFAAALIFQELVKLLWGPDYKSIPSVVSGYVTILGVRVVNQKLLALAVAIVLVSVLFLFIKQTKMGKATRAVAQNLEVARLVGINVSRVLMVSMGISVLLAGLAAVFFAPLSVVSPIDWTVLFQFFPVVVLGGLGSLKGSLVASFFIAFIEKIIEFTIGGGYLMQTVTFVIMIVILFVRPSGLFGKSMEK
jgi:branched-chain amino acid transport system permease protein